MRINRKSIATLLTILSVSVCCASAFSPAAFADEGDAGGEPPGTGSSSCSSNNCYSKNYGAVWYYYKFRHKDKNEDGKEVWKPGADHSIDMPEISVSSSRQTVDATCGDVGGFYFLGYEGHQRDNMASGWQLGPVNIGNTKLMGGSIVRLGPASTKSKTDKTPIFKDIPLKGDRTHSGTTKKGKKWEEEAYVIDKEKKINEEFPNYGFTLKSWKQAKAAYNEAQGRGLLPAPYNKAAWGEKGSKNLVWFCYSYDDSESFYSKSKVTVDGVKFKDKSNVTPNDTTGVEPDPAVIEISPDQTSAKVKFTHYIRVKTTKKLFKRMKDTNARTSYTISQSKYKANSSVDKGTARAATEDMEQLENYVDDSKDKDANWEYIWQKVIEMPEVEVKVEPGKKQKVCQKIDYSTKHFTMTDDNKFVQDKDSAASEICVTIKRGGAGGSFYSKSKVTADDVVFQKKDNGDSSNITGIDEDNVKPTPYTITIPRSQESKKVKFTHYIRMKTTEESYKKAQSAGASTTWTVSQQNYEPNNNVKSGITYTNGSMTQKENYVNEGEYIWQQIIEMPEVDVKVGIKETKTVCQKIAYSTKNFKIDGSTFKPNGDKEASSICIQIYRSDIDCPPGECPDPGNPGTPVSPPPKVYSCPLSYDHNANYGNTVAETVVKNYNGNNPSWKTEVLAKPGDQIQFRHTLCYGAQVVTRSLSNNAPREKGHVTNNWFNLESRIDGGTENNYLFNRYHLASRTYLDRASSRPSQLSSINPESSFDWGFQLFSPKLAQTGGASSYASNPYNCAFYDGNISFIYQVPGFGEKYNPSCNSAWINGSGAVSKSNVGHTVSQSMVYNDVKAWVDQQRVEPHCGCTADDSSNDRSGYSYYVGYPGGNGYLDQPCNATGGCSSYHSCSYIDHYTSDGSPVYKSCSWTNYGTQHQLGTRTTYYPISVSDPQAEKTAEVRIPYNFTTSVEAAIERSDDIVYAGQDAWAYYNVYAFERQNSEVDSKRAYMTMTPNDTLVQLMSFTINGNIGAGEDNEGRADVARTYTRTAGVSNRNESIRDYLTRKIGWYNGVSNFQIMNGFAHGSNERAINEGGKLHGDNGNGSSADYYNGVRYSVNVPDVEVGSKFCVVVGINHADSHDIFSSSSVVPVGSNQKGSDSLNNASPRWRVSNASCRTIVKKPSFQAWGGMYTQGKVITSSSAKYTYGGGDHIFGSWTDTLAIGTGSLYQLSSGAATGYAKDNGGGSANKSVSYCDRIKMTIANDNRTLCDNNVSGQAGAIAGISDKLDQILSRYTPISPTTRSDGYEVGSDYARNEADVLQNGGRYTYVNGNAYVNTPLIQYEGTRVIHLNKSTGRSKLYINQNICTGYSGSCRYTDNRLVLNERNSENYYGIEQIPQVIIIVENGDIEIDANVTQIDAWLFAPNGNINTCTAYHSNADTCDKTLIFNGPVFAKTLALNRTAGAYPGKNNMGYASANKDLASDKSSSQAIGGRGLNVNNEPTLSAPGDWSGYGSAVSGEIFNLRPDAYFWAYNQANRLSQANVVYMRELAPRY